MDSNNYSNDNKRLNQVLLSNQIPVVMKQKIKIYVLQFLLLSTIAGLSGCTLKTPVTDGHHRDALPAPEMVAKQPDSRMVASHSLTREGYAFLNSGDYNSAIRVLERAISINPSDGPGYYYLAEAWVGKNNYNLALQFNRLAGIYLRKDNHWNRLSLAQKTRIEGHIKKQAK